MLGLLFGNKGFNFFQKEPIELFDEHEAASQAKFFDCFSFYSRYYITLVFVVLIQFVSVGARRNFLYKRFP